MIIKTLHDLRYKLIIFNSIVNLTKTPTVAAASAASKENHQENNIYVEVVGIEIDVSFLPHHNLVLNGSMSSETVKPGD